MINNILQIQLIAIAYVIYVQIYFRKRIVIYSFLWRFMAMCRIAASQLKISIRGTRDKFISHCSRRTHRAS